MTIKLLFVASLSAVTKPSQFTRVVVVGFDEERAGHLVCGKFVYTLVRTGNIIRSQIRLLANQRSLHFELCVLTVTVTHSSDEPHLPTFAAAADLLNSRTLSLY